MAHHRSIYPQSTFFEPGRDTENLLVSIFTSKYTIIGRVDLEDFQVLMSLSEMYERAILTIISKCIFEFKITMF